MKWNSDENQRLIIDNGSWNFRATTTNHSSPYSCLSRLSVDLKSNKPTIHKNLASFINEADSKHLNTQTKGVLTNYVALNTILSDMAPSLQMSNEKRFFKNFSLTLSQNTFEPKRSVCNQLEFLFELAGFGAVRLVKKGEGVFDNGCGVLVDIGHSGVSITPVFGDKIIKRAFRRLDIGGKILTKCLMDNISTTQIKINDHFFAGTDMKEQLCYCHPGSSIDLKRDIEKKRIEQAFYMLPDYTIQKRGRRVNKEFAETRIKDVIKLDTERVVIPEILFDPSM